MATPVHKVKIHSGVHQVQLPNGAHGDAGTVFYLSDDDYVKIPAAAFGVDIDDLTTEIAPAPVGVNSLYMHVTPLITLSTVTAATIYSWVPAFAGSIVSVAFVVNTAVTTSAKAATLTWKDGTTATTGGAISLTSAAATPAYKIIQGSQVTANNTFVANDTLNLVASSVTAFVEGDGFVVTFLQSTTYVPTQV